jgi:hypothetical protein
MNVKNKFEPRIFINGWIVFFTISSLFLILKYTLPILFNLIPSDKPAPAAPAYVQFIFMVAHLAPYLIGYGAVGFIISRLFRRYRQRVFIGVTAICLIALGYPFAVNWSVWRAADVVRAHDKQLPEPIQLSGNLLIKGINGCNGLCQRLLYNGAAKHVLVQGQETGLGQQTSTILAYSIQQGALCSDKGLNLRFEHGWGEPYFEDKGANDRIQRRLVLGECVAAHDGASMPIEWVLESSSPTGIRGFPFELDPASFLPRPAIGSMRLEVRRVEANGESVVFRRTTTRFVPIWPIFLVQTRDIFSGQWANYFQPEGLYKTIFGNNVRIPDDISNFDALRLAIKARIDDPEASADDIGLFGNAYLSSVDRISDVDTDNIEAFQKLLIEPRFRPSGRFGRHIKDLSCSNLRRLAVPLMTRLKMEMPKHGLHFPYMYAVALSRLNDAQFSELAPELENIVAINPSALMNLASNLQARLESLKPNDQYSVELRRRPKMDVCDR